MPRTATLVASLLAAGLAAVSLQQYRELRYLRNAAAFAAAAAAAAPPPPPSGSAAPPAPAAAAPPTPAPVPAPSAQVSDDEVLRRFYERWIPLTEPTVWKNHWFGIQTLQNPMDLWVTQEILWEVRPDFVIEAGSWRGGSAALWATVLDQINPEGRIISIDIEDNMAEARKLPIVQRKVDFIIGSSVSAEVVTGIERRVRGKKVVVILDSAHKRDHVLMELMVYSRFVNVGSYIIVQDTFVNGHPALPDYGPGPWEATHDFLAMNTGFVADRSRERLLFTFCPEGFLRRVK